MADIDSDSGFASDESGDSSNASFSSYRSSDSESALIDEDLERLNDPDSEEDHAPDRLVAPVHSLAYGPGTHPALEKDPPLSPLSTLTVAENPEFPPEKVVGGEWMYVPVRRPTSDPIKRALFEEKKRQHRIEKEVLKAKKEGRPVTRIMDDGSAVILGDDGTPVFPSEDEVMDQINQALAIQDPDDNTPKVSAEAVAEAAAADAAIAAAEAEADAFAAADEAAAAAAVAAKKGSKGRGGSSTKTALTSENTPAPPPPPVVVPNSLFSGSAAAAAAEHGLASSGLPTGDEPPTVRPVAVPPPAPPSSSIPRHSPSSSSAGSGRAQSDSSSHSGASQTRASSSTAVVGAPDTAGVPATPPPPPSAALHSLGSGKDPRRTPVPSDGETPRIPPMKTHQGRTSATDVPEDDAPPTRKVNGKEAVFTPPWLVRKIRFGGAPVHLVHPRKPLYFRVGVSSIVVRRAFRDAGFKKTDDDDWNAYWGRHLKGAELRALKPYQKVNHFPRTWELGRKDKMYKNIIAMQRKHGKEAFDFVPETLMMPEHKKAFVEAFNRRPNQAWILKPRAGARGVGIRVITQMQQVVNYTRRCLVSRYLSDPYLINGFKFDLRLYVLVTSWDPLRVYLYDEGLTRFATVKYQNPFRNKSSENSFVHLTNFSLNKKSETFVTNTDAEADDEGSKWSLSALWRYFERRGINTKRIWNDMKDVMLKTILSVEPQVTAGVKMYLPHRGQAFELFGFDILLDRQLKPWLLEVNVSPSLGSPSPLDKKIKGELTIDTFNLLGFEAVDRKKYMAKLAKKVSERIQSTGRQRSKSASYLNKSGKTGIRDQSCVWGKGAPSLESFLASLNEEEKEIIDETFGEFQRKGHYQILFPTLKSDHYFDYFEFPRHNNLLLFEWLKAEKRARDIAESVRATPGVSDAVSAAQGITPPPPSTTTTSSATSTSTTSRETRATAPAGTTSGAAAVPAPGGEVTTVAPATPPPPAKPKVHTSSRPKGTRYIPAPMNSAPVKGAGPTQLLLKHPTIMMPSVPYKIRPSSTDSIGTRKRSMSAPSLLMGAGSAPSAPGVSASSSVAGGQHWGRCTHVACPTWKPRFMAEPPAESSGAAGILLKAHGVTLSNARKASGSGDPLVAAAASSLAAMSIRRSSSSSGSKKGRGSSSASSKRR